MVTKPSLLSLRPRQVLSQAILWQSPYPDSPGGGIGTTEGKAGMRTTAPFPEWGSELAWELVAKHASPTASRGPSSPTFRSHGG